MVEAELKYPDQIDDIVNRASQLFVTGLMAAKNQDLDIAQTNFIEYEEDPENQAKRVKMSIFPPEKLSHSIAA